MYSWGYIGTKYKNMTDTTKQLIYRESYLSQDEVDTINMYYETMNFGYGESRGPYNNPLMELGWQGCYDTTARPEKPNNPIKHLFDRLEKDFGEMIFWRKSIRHFHAPFDVHDDYPHSEAHQEVMKRFDVTEDMKGFTFLIPLWWEKGYKPGTACFNSPPEEDEPLYEEHQDILPQYSSLYYERRKQMIHPAENVPRGPYSVREIMHWKNVGDLIGWENYVLHSSTHTPNWVYSRDKEVKRFISIDGKLK